LDESDEEDDDSASNISDDYRSEEDESLPRKLQQRTPIPQLSVPIPQLSVPTQDTPSEIDQHEPQLLHQQTTNEVDFTKDIQQKIVTHDSNEPPQLQSNYIQEAIKPTILTKPEVIPIENNNINESDINESDINDNDVNNDEQFHIDLNKSIKEIYINDKKRKNEKKIKKILGVKMNYDTYIQQDKKKLRNYLILNPNITKA
jgi:hypothetical protein